MGRGLPLHIMEKDNEILARNQRTVGIGIMSAIVWAGMLISGDEKISLPDCVDIAEELFAEVERVDPDEEALTEDRK